MASIKELIDKLDEKFINGDVTESVYLNLKSKLEAKLDSTASNSSAPQQPSSTINQSPPVFNSMFMSGNPDGIGNQGSRESAMNSASGSSSGSGWQVDEGMQLQPGDKLGNQFIISKYLSKGGFGSVYQAHDSLMDEEVALKVIFPELDKADTAFKQLVNEVRSRSRISNRRHILEVSTPLQFSLKNLAVIALPMELATGGNLRDYLNNKPSDMSDEDWEKQLINFYREACVGVKAIHEAGFTHQDIKPDNLLICTDPDTNQQIVKVADFGLAKAKNKVKGLKRGSGTPAYMSPEQFDARVKDLKPSSDVYSLGCVLFELFDEDPPFEGSDREEYKRLHKEKIPEMDYIPNKYRSVIQKCLEKDSINRYQSAAELLEAIEEIPRLEEAKRNAEEQRKAEATEKLRRKEEARLEAEERLEKERRIAEENKKRQEKMGGVIFKLRSCIDDGDYKRGIVVSEAAIHEFGNVAEIIALHYRLLEMKTEAIERLRQEREAEERRREERREQERLERERKVEEKRRKEAEARKWESFSGGRLLRHRDTKIIQDKKTCLEWLVGPDNNITHYDAGNWVHSLGNGWRMPSKHELKELYNSGITTKSWGPFKNRGCRIWSKEIKPDKSSLACYVYFTNGNERWYDRDVVNGRRAFAVRPRG